MRMSLFNIMLKQTCTKLKYTRENQMKTLKVR